jgi:hypothetical protein
MLLREQGDGPRTARFPDWSMLRSRWRPCPRTAGRTSFRPLIPPDKSANRVQRLEPTRDLREGYKRRDAQPTDEHRHSSNLRAPLPSLGFHLWGGVVGSAQGSRTLRAARFAWVAADAKHAAQRCKHKARSAALPPFSASESGHSEARLASFERETQRRSSRRFEIGQMGRIFLRVR